MPDTDLVPVAAADTRRARLEHEGAVLSRTLDIIEQARHRVLASAPPGSEYAPVVADKVAKQHEKLLSQWTEVWTVRDRALLAAFAAATPATDAEDMDEDEGAPTFVPAVDLGGWLARMEAIRDANRATVTIVRVPDTHCEGWCGQACPPSELTEVETDGHTARLCPACAQRQAGTQAKQLAARPTARRRTRKPTPRPAPRNGNGADA